MTGLIDRLSAERLRQRSPAFRWLWAHHDEVRDILGAREKRNRGNPIWSLLSSLSGGLSKGALRQAWPQVHWKWTEADAALRTALAETADDRPVRVSGSSAFSGHAASELSLPDITGMKI